MPNYDYSAKYESLHILDYVCILISFLLISLPLLFGIINQNVFNQVAQKEFHMTQLKNALDSFFIASSNVPSERKYPISVCSGQPNEVDYEYTLARHISGAETNLNTFAYIKEKDFPFDPYGVYSTTKNNRPIKLRPCDSVFSKEDDVNKVYSGNLKSCNFQKSHPDSKFRNCYIYGTDNGGFVYQLGYYDEIKDKYVIFTKRREEKESRSVVDR
jgi:hypothetical protein